MRRILLITLLCLAAFAACGKSEEVKDEPTGKIDAMTTKVADKAVKKIRSPLDKARATRNLGDERLKAMDKALQDSE